MDVFKSCKLSLQRWAVLKLIYDHVFEENANSSELLILYPMLENDFWKCENGSTKSRLVKRNKTRVLEKVNVFHYTTLDDCQILTHFYTCFYGVFKRLLSEFRSIS